MLKSQRAHRGGGKDGKWDEKMEFLNEEDGIEGGIWRGEKGRGGTKSAAREREDRDEKTGLFLCLVNGQVDDFICRHVLMIGRRLPQHR